MGGLLPRWSCGRCGLAKVTQVDLSCHGRFQRQPQRERSDFLRLIFPMPAMQVSCRDHEEVMSERNVILGNATPDGIKVAHVIRKQQFCTSGRSDFNGSRHLPLNCVQR